MSENKYENISFVEPPIYTEFDVETLANKLRSFGMGDKVHDEINDCAVAWAYIQESLNDQGWSQELKDKFMERIIKIKARINTLELAKAKSLGL